MGIENLPNIVMIMLVQLYDCVCIYYLCVKIMPTLLAIPEVTALGQSYLDGTFMGDIDLYPRRQISLVQAIELIVQMVLRDASMSHPLRDFESMLRLDIVCVCVNTIRE